MAEEKSYKIGQAIPELKFDVAHPLGVTIFELPKPPLPLGAKGKAVQKLCLAMVKIGILKSAWVSDELSGRVAKALTSFQRDWGLKASEQYDAATRAAMAHALNGEEPPQVAKLPSVPVPVASGGDAGAKILAQAHQYLGVHEEPHAANSDRGGPIDQWLDRSGIGPGNAWCVAFATSMVADAGYALPFGKKGILYFCGTVIDEAKSAGRWLDRSEWRKVKPGFIAIEAPDVHAMLVISISKDGATQTDIAGNSSAPPRNPAHPDAPYSSGPDDGEIVAVHTHSVASMAGWVRTW